MRHDFKKHSPYKSNGENNPEVMGWWLFPRRLNAEVISYFRCEEVVKHHSLDHTGKSHR